MHFQFHAVFGKKCLIPRVPTRTGNLEKWEGIFQLGNFEQTGMPGKITQNTREVKEF